MRINSAKIVTFRGFFKLQKFFPARISDNKVLIFIGTQLNNPYRNISIDTGPDYDEEYISALYFVFTSLTTVGFGNIAPNSVIEKSFSVIVLVLGGMYREIIYPRHKI